MKVTVLVIGGKPILDLEVNGWGDVETELLKNNPRLLDDRGGGYVRCYSINGESVTRASVIKEGDIVTVHGLFCD